MADLAKDLERMFFLLGKQQLTAEGAVAFINDRRASLLAAAGAVPKSEAPRERKTMAYLLAAWSAGNVAKHAGADRVCPVGMRGNQRAAWFKGYDYNGGK